MSDFLLLNKFVRILWQVHFKKRKFWVSRATYSGYCLPFWISSWLLYTLQYLQYTICWWNCRKITKNVFRSTNVFPGGHKFSEPWILLSFSWKTDPNMAHWFIFLNDISSTATKMDLQPDLRTPLWFFDAEFKQSGILKFHPENGLKVTKRRRNEEHPVRFTFFDFDLWVEISAILVKIRRNLNSSRSLGENRPRVCCGESLLSEGVLQWIYRIVAAIKLNRKIS